MWAFAPVYAEGLRQLLAVAAVGAVALGHQPTKAIERVQLWQT